MTKIINKKNNFKSKKYNSNWPPKENEIQRILGSVKNIFSGEYIKVIIKWDTPKIMTKYIHEEFNKINNQFIKKKYKIKGRIIELFIIKKY